MSNTRVRHLYSYMDGLHRFIHSDKLVIYNSSYRRGYVGYGNYLYELRSSVNDCCHVTAKEFYYSHKYCCVAIIDRENKRIQIKHNTYNVYWLTNACPEGYEISYSLDYLSTDYVVNNRNDEEYCERWCRYLLHKHFNELYQEYAIVNNKINTIRVVYSYNKVTTIVHILKQLDILIKKYKIKQYDWYNIPLIHKYTQAYYYKGWLKQYYTIDKIPTIKQLYNGTFFTKKEQLYIIQRSFWTWFCRNKGISFKSVQDNWNKTNLSEDIIKDYDLDSNSTWNDYIRYRSRAIDEANFNVEKLNKIKSNQNREKALQEVLQSDSIINIWRSDNSNSTYIKITYSKWCRKSYQSPYKHWQVVTEHIYIGQLLDNVQLKYNRNNNTIITSKYAFVKLDDVIKAWNLFCKFKDNYIAYHGEITKDVLVSINLRDKGYKISIYPLNGIFYKEKCTDFKNPLGYKEWLVVIGCHYIWIDDFINFVKYYNLERYFNI